MIAMTKKHRLLAFVVRPHQLCLPLVVFQASKVAPHPPPLSLPSPSVPTVSGV